MRCDRRTIPVVTIALVATIWLVFLLESLQPGGSENPAVLFGFGGVTSATLYHHEFWRLVAALFVHRGLPHILGNTLVLLALGSVAEALYGRLRYLALYAAAGAGGSLVTALVARPAELEVGASAALFGLAGAILVTPWRAEWRLSRGTSRDLRLLLAATVALSIIFGGLVDGASAAHLGGLVVGVSLALALALGNRRHRDLTERASAPAAAAILIGAAMLAPTWLGPHYPTPLAEANALVADGVVHAVAGDNRAALADDDRALRVYPTDGAAFSRRGLARYNLGDTRGAIADLDRAIALDRRDVLAYNVRGLIRLRGGDAAGAVADETRALRIDPTAAPAYYDRGAARATLHDRQGALADLTRAATLFAHQRNDAAYARVEAVIAVLRRR